MPNKIANQVLHRLIKLEETFTAHLIEGTGVKKDILWLKWMVMGIAGGIGVIVTSMIVFFLKG